MASNGRTLLPLLRNKEQAALEAFFAHNQWGIHKASKEQIEQYLE